MAHIVVSNLNNSKLEINNRAHARVCEKKRNLRKKRYEEDLQR